MTEHEHRYVAVAKITRKDGALALTRLLWYLPPLYGAIMSSKYTIS